MRASIARLSVAAVSSLLVVSACQCGDKPSDDTSASTDDGRDSLQRKSLGVFLAGLPAPKVKTPLEAIPDGLPWVAQSDDPAAWKQWAEQQPFAKTMLASPLMEDIRVSDAWLAIEGLRFQVARAAFFAGGSHDSDALWRGPTAIAARDLDGSNPDFVLIKKVDPELQVVARFVGAFAALAGNGEPPPPPGPDDPPRLNVEEKEVAGMTVRSVARGAQRVSFSLFRDLLIVGSSQSLVERATALAAGAALDRPAKGKPGEKEKDKAVGDGELAPLLANTGKSGVHIARRFDDDSPWGLFGLGGAGVTLSQDAKAPLTFRTVGGQSPEAGALSLLRYGPGSTFLGLVDGARPSAGLVKVVKERLADEGDEGPLELGGVDVEKDIIAKLDAGTALLLGAADPASAGGALGAVVAFRHSDKAGLEPAVRKALGGITDREVERTVLEDQGGAMLLSTGSDLPAAALTDDALLLSLSPESLRMAIAAGAGKAPSLKDKSGVSLDGQASQAIFLDLDSAATFLNGFYAAELGRLDGMRGDEMEVALGPTFEALRSGGSLFAKLSGSSDKSEGALRALP
jgi:hypothetical protein